jgi:hypothetical protein
MNINIKLAAFGVPRTGDTALVEYFQELSTSYQRAHVQGQDAFKEYSVKGYNDGKLLIHAFLSDHELLNPYLSISLFFE